jgi:Peroxiredoxin
MKKSSLVALLVLSLTITSFAQPKSKDHPFTLTGKIVGKESGKIMLLYEKESGLVRDTALIENGEFIFKGNIPEPVKADIVGEQRNHFEGEANFASIYLESGVMHITLEAEKFSKLKMTGSKSQDEYAELKRTEQPLAVIDDQLSKKFNMLWDRLKKVTDEKQKEEIEKAREDLFQQHLMLPIRTEKEFIIKYPNSYLSADLLVKFCEKETIPLDSIKLLYNRMNKKIQNSTKGQNIKKDISRKENSIIGTTAPDFMAKDLHQQTVSLSQLKEKNVVLLDFWASWCGSCRASIPSVMKLYKEYHPKGLEIVAVTIDEDQKKWISAVKKDKTDMWSHISSTKKFASKSVKNAQDDISKKYAVNLIPTYILVDKSGNIVGRWIGLCKKNEKDLAEKLAELLKEK